jgi:hypothetical protein
MEFAEDILYQDQDTNYIKSYADRISIKILATNKFNTFRLWDQFLNSSIQYRSDNGYTRAEDYQPQPTRARLWQERSPGITEVVYSSLKLPGHPADHLEGLVSFVPVLVLLIGITSVSPSGLTRESQLSRKRKTL